MREGVILKLLEDRGDFWTLQQLSEVLGLSTRTLRNDMKRIEEIAPAHGFAVEHHSKLGYFLHVLDRKQYEAYQKSLSPMVTEPSEKRVARMLEILLLEDHFVTIQQFSEALSISPSMVKQDVKKVETLLARGNLNLQRKPHYGLRVEGSISCQLEMLRHLVEKEDRIEALYAKYEVSSQEMVVAKLHRTLSTYHIKGNTAELNEVELLVQLLYLRAFLRSQHASHEVDVEEGSLLYDIFEDMSVYLLQEEREYIRNLLHRMERTYEGEFVEKDYLQDTISQFFVDVDGEYGTHFIEDHEFFNLLYLHIVAMLERAKRGERVKNYFSEQISHQYPYIFNLAIKLSRQLEMQYGVSINQAEIGFIATHMAVPFEKENENTLRKPYRIALICSSGGGSAYLIKMKLAGIFPNAELVDFTLLDQKKILEFRPDLVFSIARLSFEVEAPIILIKEILDDIDYLKIKDSVRYAKDFKEMPNPLHTFLGMFRKDLFRVVKERISYKDLLYDMAEEVAEKGLAASSYPEDVWERESCMNTIYTHGLTIAHPIEMHGLENRIALALVQTDIEHEGKKPSIIFMVSLVPKDIDLHRLITSHISQIMEHKEWVEALKESKTYEECMHRMKIYLGGDTE